VAHASACGLWKFLNPNFAVQTRRGKMFCHSERSEESLFDLSVKKQGEILRFAQNDNTLSFTADESPTPAPLDASRYKDI
jgi:hypothetical protein